MLAPIAEKRSAHAQRNSMMPIPTLSTAELDSLRRYNTPTISNAIELFDVRPRHVGYLPHTIRCLLPNLGPIVGYAVTSQTRAAPAEAGETRVDLLGDYLRYVASVPGPKIAVGWDRDTPPGLGAQFGEVTATIHQKLGCVGHITSGCPRDLDEVEALGFQLFGLNPCVSHAHVRLIDFGTPVMIGGVEIKSGDLIHADKHGVCLIPHEIAPKLAAACVEVESRERPLLEMCRGDNFSLEEYIKLRAVKHDKIGE
jgi:4-hydroxy-4-methyl-2-oxoglutarate aldolase